MAADDVTEVVLDDSILAFDGRIFECFREHVAEPTRIHVRHLSVHVTGPDRGERFSFHFAPAPDPVAGVKVKVPRDRFDEVRAFVERMRTSRPSDLGGK